MKNYVARVNSSGALYHLSAKDDDAAYRIFGKVVFKMMGTDSPNFDTGNVDIDLVEIANTPIGHVAILFPDDDVEGGDPSHD